MRRLLLAATALTLAAPAVAQDNTARVIDEGMNHSEVMTTVEQLTDVIGPRMTNSPNMRRAEAWTAATFTKWGLKNVHKEGFRFGRGWSIERSSVRMVTPRPIQLTAIPIAWTPAVSASAPVIVAPIRRERDFDKWRGKLAGKIVMITLPNTGDEPKEAPFQRLSDSDIAKLDTFDQPRNDPEGRARRMKRVGFAKALDTFLKGEGAVAYATMSRGDGKLVHGEGSLFQKADDAQVAGVEIAAEDYRRLARLAKVGAAPTLEIQSDVRFDDSDENAYNIIAEIPGTDPKAGYVMAGAHLDSWAAADGAADNAAGSAMIMEAARIIARTGIRPKRTIRFALWAGEEQGLLGSLAYIEQHLAHRGGPNDAVLNGDRAYYGWPSRFPITPKPEYNQLAAYFNIDNGSGKLRGLYTEGNTAVGSVFRDWLAPFDSMGASSVVASKTGGTDHVFLQSIGIPGYQFIQDPLDYDSRIHHTSIDTFDHLKADDMRQGATVLAGVLLRAADADKALPRSPLPTEPVVTDPFAYTADDD